jgi:bacterioferritin-associated ferredoxin
MLRIMIAVCLLALPVLSRVVLADTDAPPKVSPSEQIQFQQKTVEAQMQELQERMFHLADLTRDTEPDDSSRLLMAVRKAREDLILEQMRDCIDQLSHADLSKASDEQEQIMVKLNELKKLLTTTDLDLQMQLDKLKKLNDSIAKLDKGIKEERREQTQTSELAKAPTTQPTDLAAPKGDQQKNRKATEAVAQTLKDLGGETAKSGDTLGNAAQSMSLAEGHLGAGQPGQASPLQARAADTMQGVKDDLEKQRNKLLDELEHQVRQQVVANLQEMLDRQKSIRGATEAVVARSITSDREVQLRVKQLGPAEQAVVRICVDTQELVDQTQFSVALPPALADLKDAEQSVADRLATGGADAPLVDDQKQIEKSLQDLLDTFKHLAAQQGEGGQCHGCKGNKNKLLAELKVMRMLQIRVTDHTTKLDAQRLAVGDSPDVQTKISAVHDEQEHVHTAMQKLQDELEAQ